MNIEQQGRLIDALRGESGIAADPADAAQRAGQLLRALVMDDLETESAITKPADDALIARLRAHGAFEPSPPAMRWRWLTLRWPNLRWVALPSLATALGAGLLMLRPLVGPPVGPLDDGASPTTQMRGAEQAQRVATADPAAWSAELQVLFAARGVALRRVDLPAGQGIELQALLPAGATALRQALTERGITVPPHGRLFLRVVAQKKN